MSLSSGTPHSSRSQRLSQDAEGSHRKMLCVSAVLLNRTEILEWWLGRASCWLDWPWIRRVAASDVESRILHLLGARMTGTCLVYVVLWIELRTLCLRGIMVHKDELELGKEKGKLSFNPVETVTTSCLRRSKFEKGIVSPRRVN